MTSVLDGMTFDRSPLFGYWFPDPISQTSMAANAYVGGLAPRPGVTWETPERYANHPPTNVPIYSGFNGKIFNFYNELDFALDKWQTGQNLKPNETERYTCHAYSAVHNDGNFLYGGTYPPLRFPSDTYEIYAHCAEGRSYAFGANFVPGVKGSFDLAKDFTSDRANNFTDAIYDHSGQFRGTLMMRHKFWRVLQETAFSITPSKAKP